MSKLNYYLFMITLIGLSVLGLLTSDIYLPNMPTIAKVLHTNIHGMQITISIYLCGLAIGQIVIGHYADIYNRKMLLNICLMIFLVASLISIFSINLYMLCITRFLQAIGASAGLIISRSLVASLYDAKESAKIFTTIFPFVGMSPAIAPIIGGYLGFHFGWQSIFVCLACIAIVLIGLSSIAISNDNREVEATQNHNFLSIIKYYLSLLTDLKFLCYASAPCFAYIVYFAYMSQTPFIFHHFDYDAKQIGYFYITLSLTYLVGNLVGKYLLKSNSLNKVLTIGYWIFLLGGLLFMSVFLFSNKLLIIVVSISCITFANGFLIPLGIGGVMGSFKQNSGKAAGLLGFMQLLCAAGSSYLIGYVSLNNINRMSCYFVFMVLLTLLVYYSLRFLLRSFRTV